MRTFIAVLFLVSISAAARAAPPVRPPPGQVDCNQLASMPNAPMNVEQCKQMMGMAQAQQSMPVGADAARPGDDKMSCDAIAAELSSMSGSVSMSKERLAEGEAASKDYQEEAARQQAKGEVMAAKQSATIKAAMAADTATEIASGGTIKGRAGNAAGMAAIKESAVEGARSQAMLKPKEERVTGATIANMEDVNRNMQANPRMIRLADLAMARKCKVMGEGAQ